MFNFKQFTRCVSAAVIILAAGCGREIRSYDTSIEEESQVAIDGGTQFRSVVVVTNKSTAETRRVRTIVTNLAARGPFTWDVETYNIRGQKVVLHHDELNKRLVVNVDDKPPVEIHQQLDRKYVYDRQSFRDEKSDRYALAREVADDLRRDRLEDDSMVANFRSSMNACNKLPDCKGRLFLAFAFVDIYTNISDLLDVNLGTGTINN